MTKKREGDLRLLKDGVVFGPTDRAGLEKLLAAGRLTLADHVSVRNADWVSVAEFLSAPTAMPVAKAAPTAEIIPASTVAKKGNLRILSGGRVISSLTRKEVEQLRAAARIGDDDLVCALHGPWMPVGDFLTPPPPEPPRVEAAPVEPQREAPQDTTSQVVAPMHHPSLPARVAQVAPSPPSTVAPRVVVPPAPVRVPAAVSLPAPAPLPPAPPPSPPLIASHSLPPSRPAAQRAAVYSMAGIRPPPPRHDEWYVRVRGIHSAPLRKQHVKALYQAREITLDCVARHASWHDNDWRPIHSITQLADITRP
ncbi:MAG TPA: hypothetical protein VFI31_04080 [Pirellulales bacterium]|nr:hypothetical protein [Pirellulales bacterium]